MNQHDHYKEITPPDVWEYLKELEQKLSDSEADWLKMRDIAEETQSKLDEALEVVFKITHDTCNDCNETQNFTCIVCTLERENTKLRQELADVTQMLERYKELSDAFIKVSCKNTPH